MLVQYLGGCADGQWLYVQTPLPPMRNVYCVKTGKVDWYELKYDKNDAPYYHYTYSTS